MVMNEPVALGPGEKEKQKKQLTWKTDWNAKFVLYMPIWSEFGLSTKNTSSQNSNVKLT